MSPTFMIFIIFIGICILINQTLILHKFDRIERLLSKEFSVKLTITNLYKPHLDSYSCEGSIAPKKE